MLDRIRQRWRERRMWADARTLEDLGELTAQWLEGRIAHQPGYYGPVDVDEDLAPGMRETLARLNRAGFVTSGSQAGFAHDDAGGFTQMAAVEGFATPAAAEALRLAGDDYRVTSRGDGVPVSHLDGEPYTTFGRQMSRRGVARVYPGCHRDAVTALSTAERVVICDPQIGRNSLWAALDGAVLQSEPEDTTMTTYDDLTPVQRNIHNKVLGYAGRDGTDCKDILDRITADTDDKAAVAEVLGGPGAGDEFRTTTTPDAAGQPDEQDPGYHNAAHLRRLADRCERGAQELQRAADDPAGVLAERGYHNQPGAQEWGARKAAAAAAARDYAAHLRIMADDPSYRAPAEQFAEAEKVATAAECDGILIDGSRLTESAVEHGWHDEVGKQALRDHQAADDAAVQGSGMFGHVAETINGVQQVPYWQLGGAKTTDTNDKSPRGDAKTPQADHQEDTTVAKHKKQNRTYNGPVDARGTSFGSGNVYHVDADAADLIRDLADRADSDEPGRDSTSTTVFYGTVTADSSSFGDAPTHNTFTRGSGADDGNDSGAQSDPADAQIADEDRSLPDSTIDALWGQGTTHDRDRWNAMRRDGSAADQQDDDGDQGHSGPASAHVGASAGAGETVVVQGDAVGSGSHTGRKPSPHRDRTAGTAKTTDTAGASRGATNIGAVTIGSGTVNAGGDIVGQQNVTRQASDANRTAEAPVAVDNEPPANNTKGTDMNDRSDQPVDARGTHFGQGNVHHVAADDGTVQDVTGTAGTGDSRSGDATWTTTFNGPVSTDGANFGVGDVHNTNVVASHHADDGADDGW